MFDPANMMSGAHIVQEGLLLFFTLFVLSVTKWRAWKQVPLSILWASLCGICLLFVRGNYVYAKEMIYKTAMSEDMVCLLREYVNSGVNVDLQDEEGRTPLMAAVYCNSKANVRFLLSRGANPDLKSRYGKSARDIAREYHLHEMIPLLK
jgi:hypothetical protein